MADFDWSSAVEEEEPGFDWGSAVAEPEEQPPAAPERPRARLEERGIPPLPPLSLEGTGPIPETDREPGVVSPAAAHTGEFLKGLARAPFEFTGTALRGTAPKTVGRAAHAMGWDELPPTEVRAELGVLANEARGSAEMSEKAFVSMLGRARELMPLAVRSAFSGQAWDVRRGKIKPEQFNPGRFIPPAIEEEELYRAGEFVGGLGEMAMPRAPGYEESIPGQLGSGLGTLATGMVATMLYPPAGYALFTVAGMGEAVDRAVEEGATEEQIRASGIAGTIPGATDVVPVEILLDRLKIPLPYVGPFLRFAGRVGLVAAVEAFQEGGQKWLQNLIAREVYKPEQALTEGVIPEAGIGGGVGAIAETIMYPLRRRGGGGAPRPPPPDQLGNAFARSIEQAEFDVPAKEIARRELQPREGPTLPRISATLRDAEAAKVGQPQPMIEIVQAKLQERGVPPAAEPEAAPAAPTTTPLPPQPTVPRGDMAPVTTPGVPVEPEDRFAKPEPTPLEERRLETEKVPEDDTGPFPEPKNATQARDQGAWVGQRLQATERLAGERYPQAEDATDEERQAASKRAKLLKTEFDSLRELQRYYEATSTDIDQEAAKAKGHVASEDQRKAGVYKKGHFTARGVRISIENEAGTKRRPEWPTLPYHYGDVKGTEAKDGDEVDVAIKPGTTIEEIEDGKLPVFVVDQAKPDGTGFDETKSLLGYETEAEAREAYTSAYTPGWKGLKDITETTFEDWKSWLNSDQTKKAFAPTPEKVPGDVPLPGPPTPKTQYEEAKRVQPKDDDILSAIAKLGGISQAEAEAQGIDPAEFKRRGWRILRVFTKAGDSFDGMAERLGQHGYVAGDYRADDLAAKLDRALSGERVMTAEGLMARAEQEAAERQEPDWASAPDVFAPEDAAGENTEVARLVALSFEVDEAATERLVQQDIADDQLIARLSQIIEAGRRPQDRAGPEGTEEAGPPAAVEAEEPAREAPAAAPEPLALTPETPAELTAKERHERQRARPAAPPIEDLPLFATEEEKAQGDIEDVVGVKKQSAVPRREEVTQESEDEAARLRAVIADAEQAAKTAELAAEEAAKALRRTRQGSPRNRALSKQLAARTADARKHQARAEEARQELKAEKPALKKLPRLGLHIQRYPSGRYGYVGTVPDELVFEEGAKPEDIAKAKRFGERFGPKKRTFATREEAESLARERGYEPIEAAEERKAEKPDVQPFTRGDMIEPKPGTDRTERGEVWNQQYRDQGDIGWHVQIRRGHWVAARDFQVVTEKPGPTKEQAPAELPEKAKPIPPATQKRAAHLRQLADRMTAQIEDKQRPMTQNATPKRLREYQSRRIDGADLERGQRALRAIADAMEAGTLPDVLKGVTSKAKALPLVRHRTGSTGYYDVHDTGEYADTSPEGKALQALIEPKGEERAVAAEKQKAAEIGRLESQVALLNIPGYFPTSPAVAKRMVEMADIEPGDRVLEPSAGKGNIADAIRDAHPDADISVIEVNYSLAEVLRAKGYEVQQGNFLEITPKPAPDVIIQNPPFEKGQDIEHVRHAYEVLKPGGRLVSIVSEGPFFREDKKAAAFREWLDEQGGTSEKLETGELADKTATQRAGVAGRIVVLEKAEAKPETQPEVAPETVAELPERAPAVTASSIPYQVALDAHAGSSMVPEERAKQRQEEFAGTLQGDWKNLRELTRNQAERDTLMGEWPTYAAGYRARYMAGLSADSRTMSIMITGPSNFPTARNQKRLDTASKRWNEAIEYREKALKAIRKKIRPETAAISSDDTDAATKIRAKIAKLEETQQRMKAVNAAHKRYTKNPASLEKTDLSDAEQTLVRDYKSERSWEPHPFAPYELTNNNANIRRLKKRLAEVERKTADEDAEVSFDGGRVVDNVDDNRLQIFFDEKPSAEVRNQLKSHGFHWSPKVGAWQRMRSNAANYAAEQITGVTLPGVGAKAPPKFHRVWHGSPHDIDRFGLHAIGTGEGAQYIAWGLYFADAKGVGSWYRENLSQKTWVVFDGDFVKQDEFAQRLRQEYGDRLGSYKFSGYDTDAASDLAWRILWDLNVGDFGSNAWFRDQPGDAKEIVNDIWKRIERPPSIEGTRWTVRARGGRKVEEAMPQADRALLFDMQGRISWYSKQTTDAFDRVLKELRDTVAAQDTWIEEYEKRGDTERLNEARRIHDDAARSLEMVDEYGLRAVYPPTAGHLYEVELSPQQEDYLDWDKPLSEQSEKARKAIEPALYDVRKTRADVAQLTKRWTGRELYEEVVENNDQDPESASRYLGELGIPGIRYLDQASRGAGKGTHNYVIWDESVIEIVQKQSRRPPPTKGSTTAQLSAWIRPTTLKWADDTKPALKPVQHFTDLPQDVQDEAGGPVDGVYDPSTHTVYLVADMIPTKRAALVTLGHESLGHHAMEQIVPDWGRVVKTIQGLESTDKRVGLLAREVDERYGTLPPTDRVKEILAIAVEKHIKGGTLGQIIAKIRAAIRRWLKAHGLGEVWQASELDLLLDTAQRNLYRGKYARGARDAPALAGQPLFSRRLDPSAKLDLSKVPAKYRTTKSGEPDVVMPISSAVGMTPGPEHVGIMEEGTAPTPPSKPPTGKPIRREDILGPLFKAFGKPLYEGRVKGKRLGYYLPGIGAVRVKKHADLEVAAHEIAHFIDDKFLNGFGKGDGPQQRPWLRGTGARALGAELKAISYDIKKVYEGYAEFVRLWMTQSEAAKAKAPRFSSWFETWLNRQAPKTQKALRQAQQDMAAWFQQDPVDRLASKIGAAPVVNESLHTFWEEQRQGMFDDLHGILTMEMEVSGKTYAITGGPYETARLTRGAYSAVDGAIRYGAPVWDTEGGERFVRYEGDGLIDILSPVSGSLNEWIAYAVARSAAELKSQRRENLITANEITGGLALNDRRPRGEDGKTDFERVFDQYQQWNKQVVDFAVGAGVIDPTKRARWRRSQYLPFYRVSGGRVTPATKRKGGVEGYLDLAKRLKGGTQNLNDILNNMVLNASRLITESLKNEARAETVRYALQYRTGKVAPIPKDTKPVSIDKAQLTAKVLEVMGLPRNILSGGPGVVPTDEELEMARRIEKWTLENADYINFWLFGQPPKGENVIAVMRHGKPKFYEVGDPLLLRSLHALSRPPKGDVVNTLNKARIFGQKTITMNPEFWLWRNPFRDTLHAWVFTKYGFRPFLDSFTGIYHRARHDSLYKEAIANGIGLSSLMVEEDEMRVHIEKFFTQQGQDYSVVADTPRRLIHALSTMADAFEMSTRLGEYARARKSGASPRVAAYAGREVSTDFGMRGDGQSGRLSQGLAFGYDSVLFLKAAVNGIDRVYRGAVKDQNRQRIWALSATIAGISAIVAAWNRWGGEWGECYDAMPDWQKDSYWHFYWPKGEGEGGACDQRYHHYQFPKIWEIGALASVAERSLLQIFDLWNGTHEGFPDYAGHVVSIMMDQFKLDYMAYLVEPIYEVYGRNEERFTGRPVRPLSIEEMEPYRQFTPYTSRALVKLARPTRHLPQWAQISPANTEALLRGYFNAFGAFGLMSADALVAGDEKPSMRFDQLPMVRALYRQGPSPTRWERDLYDAYKRAWATHRSLLQAQREQEEGAEITRLEDKEARLQYDLLQDAINDQRAIRKDMLEMVRDKALTAKEKRAQWDAHQRERSQSAKEAMGEFHETRRTMATGK